jgi:hypothetical protein
MDTNISQINIIGWHYLLYTACLDKRYPKYKNYTLESNFHLNLVYVIRKENSKSSFHARLTCMRQLVTFGDLSNDVDTTGTGSMRVAAIRVAISYSWSASF